MKNFFINKKINKDLNNFSQKGFSLVETLIAITVLTISITAPLVLASEGIKSTELAKEQIVAFYLAQDAIEYVKNVRDENKLSGDNQLVGLSSCDVENDPENESGCTIDTTNDNISNCSGTCSPILFDSSKNIYNHSSGSSSKFTREVKVWYEENSNVNFAFVEVLITWDSLLSQDNEYKIRSYLTNW